MDLNVRNVWDYFDMKVCLTLVESEYALGLKEFNRVGLTNVEKFKALDGIGPHQSFNLSEIAILRKFFESGGKTLLHLEDDCKFMQYSHLPAAIRELPENWDIFYLGANLIGNDTCKWPEPERISNYLYKIKHAWTTHAVAYSRRVVEYILANAPDENSCMFDGFLSDQIHGRFNCYVISPMVAWQRAHYSHIWKNVVNYDGVFQSSQKALK